MFERNQNFSYGFFGRGYEVQMLWSESMISKSKKIIVQNSSSRKKIKQQASC